MTGSDRLCHEIQGSVELHDAIMMAMKKEACGNSLLFWIGGALIKSSVFYYAENYNGQYSPAHAIHCIPTISLVAIISSDSKNCDDNSNTLWLSGKDRDVVWKAINGTFLSCHRKTRQPAVKLYHKQKN